MFMIAISTLLFEILRVGQTEEDVDKRRCVIDRNAKEGAGQVSEGNEEADHGRVGHGLAAFEDPQKHRGAGDDVEQRGGDPEELGVLQ